MIPVGFVEICAIENVPILSREYLARGAVVKYQATHIVETLTASTNKDVLLVHEFKARAGSGLTFRLAGGPDLNGKMWALKPGWVLWLQYMGLSRASGIESTQPHVWHVGSVLEIPRLKELMRRMESDHRALDHGIALESGVFRAGTLDFAEADSPIVLEAIEEFTGNDAPALPLARRLFGKKAKRSDLQDDELSSPPVAVRAARPIHALLRSLLKDGAKPREFIEEQMRAAGFSARQIIRAREALSVKARRRGVKGRRGGGVWLLELPNQQKTITRTKDVLKARRPVVLRDLADDDEATDLGELGLDDDAEDEGDAALGALLSARGRVHAR